MLILCVFVVLGVLQGSAHGRWGVTFGTFYSSLSPHGEWVMIGPGVRAWQPFAVRYDWRPYLVGHWVWTDAGWCWVSEEPWGWATYHYGRWLYHDVYGWVWLPGYEWAPAWVEWRVVDGCVGWAPLSPLMTVRYRSPVFSWSFLYTGHMTDRDIGNRILPESEARRLFGRTREGRGEGRDGVVVRAPSVGDVERVSGKRAPRMSAENLREAERPSEQRELQERNPVLRPTNSVRPERGSSDRDVIRERSESPSTDERGESGSSSRRPGR
jgi:hypothetical protein